VPTTTAVSGNQLEVTQPTVQVNDGNEDGDSEATGLAGELFPIASKLAGLAVLATGLVALIRRLRASQLRHRRPGTVPTAPPPETAATETTLRAAAAPTATEFIDLALRAMANDITGAHLPPPHVVGVHLTADTLRLLLWTPNINPPPGWDIEDEGRSWTFPTSADIAQLQHRADGVPAPYPTLVTVGHGDRSQLLLDLEFLGATRITGEPSDVIATCSTIATELAATPLADNLQVVCVGFGADLEQLERITVVGELTDVLSMLEAKASAVANAPGNSLLEGRLSPVNDGTWDPIVILHPTEQPPAEAQRLLALAHAGHGVAAIVGYPTGDRWQLQVNDNTIRIEPLGQTLGRRNLTGEEQTAVTDIVAAAKDPEGMPADFTDDPLANIDTTIDTTDGWQEPVEQTLFPDDQPSVEDSSVDAPEMKLLGTLRVDGTERDFPLTKCAEYVAYLTFHRRGVEADTLMEALWPEEPPNNDRLNRHTSKTRTALGTGPDGKPYLPYITGGLYRISPHVRNDLERFTDYIQQADRTTGDEQAQHLHAALEFVEGIPFSGAGNGYTWAHTDGIITHIIVAIDNAAHRLAQQALDNNDPDEATWAARKGLLATGACEACYRNLMRAAAAQGNQVAFEATYRELLAVTDADRGPDASAYLDPETTELYEQETRGPRRHAG
jgi:DNA-binding SARP family transcriptional activator